MSDFQTVGVIVRASTGRSLKIELTDLPFTTFNHNFYVGINALEDVLNGHKKTATIYMVKPKERNATAAKNPDL